MMRVRRVQVVVGLLVVLGAVAWFVARQMAPRSGTQASAPPVEARAEHVDTGFLAAQVITDALRWHEEWIAARRDVEWRREALRAPAGNGNAWDVYSGLEVSSSSTRQRPDEADLAAILGTIDLPLRVPPGAASVGLIVVDAMVDRGVQRLPDPNGAMLWAIAALLVAGDTRACWRGPEHDFRFSSQPEGVRIESHLREALALVRRALAAGAVRRDVLSDLALVLDALGARRDAPDHDAYEFVYAAGVVAGVDILEMDRTPAVVEDVPAGFATLQEARADALRQIRAELVVHAQAAAGPPERLEVAIAAAKARWTAPANPFLWMNEHFGSWFGACSAAMLPISGRAPILAPHAMLRSLAAYRRSLALAGAAVAVHRYAADHGAPPPSLEALVPAYAAAPPADPTTGRRLGWHAGRLWALAPDQPDDATEPPASDRAEFDTGWGFGWVTVGDDR